MMALGKLLGFAVAVAAFLGLMWLAIEIVSGAPP